MESSYGFLKANFRILDDANGDASSKVTSEILHEINLARFPVGNFGDIQPYPYAFGPNQHMKLGCRAARVIATSVVRLFTDT